MAWVPIAALFAIEVKPGAQTPRPLRPPRPKREFKRKPKTPKAAASIAPTDVVLETPADSTASQSA